MIKKLIALPIFLVFGSLALAQSQAGSFSSVVTIGGSVNQEIIGNNNTQVMSIGGMNQSNTGSFNSTVSTGSISQSANGSNIQQSLNVGSMSNSSAASFTSTVNAKKIEQVGKSGERQELDIGSVTNSRVSGSVNTTVSINQGIKQVGDGEIAIGAVKNSNIGGFNNTISVNRVEGNNIRIGSVVGGSRYDNDGNASRYMDELQGSGGGMTMPLPKFDGGSMNSKLESKTSLKKPIPNQNIDTLTPVDIYPYGPVDILEKIIHKENIDLKSFGKDILENGVIAICEKVTIEKYKFACDRVIAFRNKLYGDAINILERIFVDGDGVAALYEEGEGHEFMRRVRQIIGDSPFLPDTNTPLVPDKKPPLSQEQKEEIKKRHSNNLCAAAHNDPSWIADVVRWNYGCKK